VNTCAYPNGIGINSVTNKIYVGCPGTNGAVTVIDGSTNATTTLAVTSEWNVAVDQVRDQIYVTNTGLSVIDGKTNAISNIALSDATAIADDVLTNELYVTALSNSTVNVLSGAAGTPSTSLLNELLIAPNDLR
jgi:DNA-binding beta-propeller fold protein YncE